MPTMPGSPDPEPKSIAEQQFEASIRPERYMISLRDPRVIFDKTLNQHVIRVARTIPERHRDNVDKVIDVSAAVTKELCRLLNSFVRPNGDREKKFRKPPQVKFELVEEEGHMYFICHLESRLKICRIVIDNLTPDGREKRLNTARKLIEALNTFYEGPHL